MNQQLNSSAAPSGLPYEILDSKQLAARLNLPESWIRDQVRKRAEDCIPHLRFGKYVRFAWGSPELAGWLERRKIGTNNSRVGRARKETIQ